MTYLIRGKNFEIGDRTKEKIEAVINGIEKLLPADAFINVAVNRGKLTYKTDITLKSGKLIVRSEKEDEDMMASVDKATDNLEKQLLKIKGRKVVKRKAVDEAATEVEEVTDDDAPVIERNKKLPCGEKVFLAARTGWIEAQADEAPEKPLASRGRRSHSSERIDVSHLPGFRSHASCLSA